MATFTNHVTEYDSPRVAIMVEYNRWFATNDVESILGMLHPEIQWEMVGEETLIGIDAVRDMFQGNEEESDEIALENMTLDGVITEGRKASNYGSMKMSDGTTYRF